MDLETMRPNPVWDAESHGDAVAVLESHTGFGRIVSSSMSDGSCADS
jgi:hypothetical protein